MSTLPAADAPRSQNRPIIFSGEAFEFFQRCQYDPTILETVTESLSTLEHYTETYDSSKREFVTGTGADLTSFAGLNAAFDRFSREVLAEKKHHDAYLQARTIVDAMRNRIRHQQRIDDLVTRFVRKLKNIPHKGVVETLIAYFGTLVRSPCLPAECPRI